ncbi:MAG: SIS domain-containing protein [Chitinophagales bacterium]|nr:SIS domain-containing protein [Chitinophagales bacterium]
MINNIKNILDNHIKLVQQITNDAVLLQQIQEAVNILVTAFQNGNQLLLCGNGGSAADAQHIAAEFSNKFLKERKPLNAEALHVNSSYLTAVANDFHFNQVYAKAVQAKGKIGDVLIGLTTSGKSENIIEAFKVAKQLNITTIAFVGENRTLLQPFSDIIIAIPSNETPRIQECHILIGHIICELVEEKLF